MAFDPVEVLEELKGRGGIFELYHVTRYEGYRERSDGGEEGVTVTILDTGPDAPEGSRYHCYAEAENGGRATGNPADELGLLFATMHWGDLDETG